MKIDDFVLSIIVDIDQIEQKFQEAVTPPEITVFMTRALIRRFQQEYHGFVFSQHVSKDVMTFCGHPVRVCVGPCLEYSISVKHGTFNERGGRSMRDYISREAAIEATCESCSENGFCKGVCADTDAIRSIPAADVAEVRRGRWKPIKPYNNTYMGFECSECGAKFQGIHMDNYCGNCGAKMEEQT